MTAQPTSAFHLSTLSPGCHKFIQPLVFSLKYLEGSTKLPKPRILWSCGKEEGCVGEEVGVPKPCVAFWYKCICRRNGTEAHRTRLLSQLRHRQALTFTGTHISTLSASVTREEAMLKGLKGSRFGSVPTFSNSVFFLLWGIHHSLASSGNCDWRAVSA